MIIELLNLELSFFILRSVAGIFFMAHGYPKLFRNFRGTAEFLRSLGFRPALAWALLLGSVEFFVGLLLLIGVWTQVIAALLALVMLVALAKVKFGKESFVGGWELDFLAFGIALALVFGLPGGILWGSF